MTGLPQVPTIRTRVARLVARLLPAERTLTEAEVNDILRTVFDDPAMLRRQLFREGLVTRQASADYRLVAI